MPYLLAYFRQTYGGRVETNAEGTYTVPLPVEPFAAERLHLALSHDGRAFVPLNANRPVLPDLFLRDPFVARGPGGLWHLVATSAWSSHSLVHLTSPDLVAWSAPSHPRVMPEGTGTVNVWAPEFLPHPDGGYLVHWSSSYGPEGWSDSRIWSARTDDFRTFSRPSVLFDPGFTVIDATIVPDGGKWLMVFKDERFGHLHGEHRHLQAARAPAPEGPWTVEGGPIGPALSEGPALYRLPGTEPAKGEWALVFDRCMADDYAALVSPDGRAWTPGEGFVFPPNARHGSVAWIAEAEAERLGTAFR